MQIEDCVYQKKLHLLLSEQKPEKMDITNGTYWTNNPLALSDYHRRKCRIQHCQREDHIWIDKNVVQHVLKAMCRKQVLLDQTISKYEDEGSRLCYRPHQRVYLENILVTIY